MAESRRRPRGKDQTPREKKFNEENELVHPGHHRSTDMDNTRGQRSWHWGCESKAQADASLCGTEYKNKKIKRRKSPISQPSRLLYLDIDIVIGVKEFPFLEWAGTELTRIVYRARQTQSRN
ncbi:hypothetical protein PV325_013311 [Microctonus aethiopoides]|nr:hypothetical protein PV325_013311 [Microctonus aethiopoides]